MPDEPNEPEEIQPDYMIEGARSSRSKCKSCRKPILKDVLRLGILVEGPFGTGYMWHHLTCAAKRQWAKVEEAYTAEAWQHAKETPEDLPDLEDLRKLQEEAETKKKERKVIPYAEHDPSGRAKCKQSGEVIPKGALRVALGQEVEFGGQTRISAFLVLPGQVGAALMTPEIVAGKDMHPSELIAALKENSKSLSDDEMTGLIEAIGPLD
ncbi:MAG: hypothetical protein P1V35_00115 [Planctomycetota bacterium]|nr:hypothetical protein [Planctomycetota bacterium]